MTHTGRCLCGQVCYTIDAEPLGARTCWCRDCQRIASGGPTNNALFAPEAVRFAGEIATFTRIADSGNRVERGFCPHCGSQLYSRTIKPEGGPIRIRIGTLDDPELIAPQSVIWASSAPSWAVIDSRLPHLAKGPQ